MGEFIPITRTKIILPRRRVELLKRQRLLGLLDELLDNRLVIVAAPAGYGKTSLLVDFAHSTQWPVCWYSLDTLDADPLRFIAHFISAIRARFPEFGKDCFSALQSMGQDGLDLDVLASLIINDAYDHITEHFTLVLDDFHMVENNRQVVYFVNRFLQDVDENCHLVLASRSLLTLPDLPLMVARSQVGGLSFDELCFQPDEIQALLEQNYHLALSDSEAAELARDTEGWVTGLLLSTQLMGKTIANRLRVARVSGVGLYEYLAQQVLAQQTEEVQDFLLRSALLGEFDVRLCDEVIGRALNIAPNWRELMDVVLRFNLFVLPVGDDGATLRYHHLFQDFLRDRIHRDAPAEARAILLRLAEVYTEREDWERAYAIYQELGETEAIVRMVEKAGSAMIAQGRLVTLSDWLNSLPAELLNRYPSLISLKGAVAVSRGECSQGIKWLDQAAAELRKMGENVQLSRALTRRSVAHRLLGHYQAALDDLEEAFANLQGEPRPNEVYADALFSKGAVLLILGQLTESMALLREVMEDFHQLGDESSAVKVLIEIGRVSRVLGRHQDAEEAYLKALAYYQITGNLVWQAILYNNLGILHHERSEYGEATRFFEKAIHCGRLGGSPRTEAYALTSIGDLYQELDAVQETLEAYRQAREIALRIHEGYLQFYLNLVESRLRQKRGENDRAYELLSAAQAMAEERGSLYEQNICRLEWGRVKMAQGYFQEASATIRAALGFFVQEGYQSETPRAWLYAMVASWQAGELAAAGEQAQQVGALLEDGEAHKSLMGAGMEIKTCLEEMHGSAAAPWNELLARLLAQIDQHEQGIPALRRVIRRQAAVVPFAPPKMVIRALGKVQVKVSDHLLAGSDWQVQTARDLFFLLLAHPEGLTKEQIGEIFWPDSTPAELKLRFKNTMYRLRHAAGKDVILFQGESLYLFNRAIDYEYDAETFVKEITLAEKNDDLEKKTEHYQNAVRWYKGPFLHDVDDTWALVERERLHQMYIDALLELANLNYSAGRYEEALKYCQRVLKEDPCQEDAHRTAMRIYAAMGSRALVVRQYEQCRLALLEELDAPPSYQTQALYDTLIQ